MLRIMNVSKAFQQETAVQDFSLNMAAGQITALIGPSGCGKSTLLKMIMGLELADNGKVMLEDVPVEPQSILQLRRKIGYVIQDGGLFPHLSARENIVLMADYLNWNKERQTQRLIELMELTQLSNGLIDRYPQQLSGGQRQRVSLMRALMLDPSVLLLDEPLGALDPLIRADLQVDLKAIFRKLNKTVLLVTHDMREAAFFGDQIVLMRDGRLIQQGKLADLLQRPADPFVTRFIKAQSSPLDDLNRN